MKRFLSLLGLILTLSSCGTTIPINETNREVNNFLFSDGSVTWSKVYQFNADDYDAIRDWFNTSFNITKEGDKSVIGETNKNSLPIQEAGLDRMAVTMLLTHPCVVYFNTDFKEDRYRVIVNRVIWYPQVAVTTHGVSQGVGAMDLNEIALQDGGYKSVFYNTSSAQLNTMLSYLFTPKLNKSRRDNDW